MTLSKHPDDVPSLKALLNSRWSDDRFPVNLDVFDDPNSDPLTVRLLGSHKDTEVLLNGNEVFDLGQPASSEITSNEIDITIQGRTEN